MIKKFNVLKSVFCVVLALCMVSSLIGLIAEKFVFAEEQSTETTYENDKGIEPSVPAPIVQPKMSIELKMCNMKTKDDTNDIKPGFLLCNTGNVPINLQDTKIRYYYTIDDEKEQDFKCDWSSIDKKNVTGRFLKLISPFEKADYYVETGFTEEAGILKPGESIEVHIKVSKKGPSGYDQTNDYSYTEEKKDYIIWNKASVYVGNEMVWGDNILFGKPSYITATPFENSVALSWSPVEGATGYDIEANGEIVGSTSVTSFEHGSLQAGTIYSYRIRAKSSALTGDWSDTVEELTLPAAPKTTGNMATEDAITVEWAASKGADGYDIEVDEQLVENVASPYVHSGLNPGTQHLYRIRAKNSSGIGNWGDYFTRWTIPPALGEIQKFATQDVIVLSWQSVQGASTYEVEFDGEINSSIDNTYSRLQLAPGTEHWFRVRAVNESGAGQWSEKMSYWTLPDTAKALKGSAIQSEITVSWEEITGAVTYDIEVDEHLYENQTSPYKHLALSSGTRHAYRVRAGNSSGYGAWSDTFIVWTLPAKVEGVKLKPGETEMEIGWEAVEGATGYELEADGQILNEAHSPYLMSGLKPGTEHSYRVRAVNSSGAGEWSDLSEAVTIPGIISSYTSQSSESSIRFAWDPVEGADSYDVEVDGSVFENISSPYICENLTSGTRYKYRVRAENASGKGRWSEVISVWTLPDVPENSNCEATDTSLTIQWDYVNGASSYDMEFDGIIINDVASPFLIGDLTAGTQHTYRIRAKNPGGEGKWSGSSSKWTKPGIVPGLDFNASKNDISISWQAVGGAEGYDISVDGIVFEGVSSPYSYKNLAPGTKHVFMVRAKNSSGLGNWCQEAESWTLPGVPENIRTSSTENAISIVWDETTGATGYEVEILNAPTSTGGANNYTHFGLNPNTQYTYKVRAVNSSGHGEWSGVIAKTTLPDIPSFKDVYATDSSVVLNWNAIAGATVYDLEIDGEIIEDINNISYTHEGLDSNSVHEYRIRSKSSHGTGSWSGIFKFYTQLPVPGDIEIQSGTDEMVISWNEVPGANGYEIEVDGSIKDNGSQTSYAHTGLIPGSEHTYRIRAKNDNTCSSWSDLFIRNTLLDAPENITASALSDSINIKWDMTADASSYDIEADGEIIDNGLGNTFVHTGLMPYSEHKYRVRVRSRGQIGVWSDYKSVFTLIGTPQGITAVPQSKQITVAWEPVEGATGYELMIDGALMDMGNQCKYIHTGLEPNSSYQYKVRARKEGINGSWSDPLTAETLLGTVAKPDITKESRKITVEWNEVEGSDAYDIEVDGVVIENLVNLYYVHAPLIPNTEHKYRVRSRCGSRTGEWSELVTALTTIGVPDNIKTQAATTSIKVSWDKVDGAVGYDIEVDGELIEGLTANTYTQDGLRANSRHTYRIRSRDADTVSECSELIVQNTVPEMIIPLKNDSTFNFVIVAPPPKGTTGRTVTVSYNANELEVFDLCAATPEPETAVGQVKGTYINITEFSPGRIVYKISGTDKTVVNIIKFISKTGGNSKVTYTIK